MSLSLSLSLVFLLRALPLCRSIHPLSHRKKEKENGNKKTGSLFLEKGGQQTLSGQKVARNEGQQRNEDENHHGEATAGALRDYPASSRDGVQPRLRSRPVSLCAGQRVAQAVPLARECVEAFKSHPHLGLIGAEEWRSQDMGKNIEHYERLLDLLGVRGRARDLDYVSGFMFLTRADVVARLFETLRRLDFEYGGDRDLDFHVDGQIAHGVERAVPALVRHMGYDILWR